MLTAEHLLFLVAHREFYESIERYAPNETELLTTVTNVLPCDWTHRRTSVWYYCFTAAAQAAMPDQGWKIHLSSAVSTAAELLQCVVPLLVATETSFKFAADFQMLTLLNSKLWSRGAGGKFLTIYPASLEMFGSLIASITAATTGFDGPFILSDKRYGASRVVHYRYGGFRAMGEVAVDGRLHPQIRKPDGTFVNDERLPYFAFPEWETDPYPTKEPEEDQGKEEGTLKNGRYTVEEALAFSNAGGIYVGIDNASGTKVLIKETRPLVYVLDSSFLATDLLKKEYEMLLLLKDLGIAPAPIDFFRDWEHYFLVEEFIEGESLSKRWAKANVLIRTRPTTEDRLQHVRAYKSTILKLCRVLAALHGKGIIFGDLSPNNLIISDDDAMLRIIDFEGACFFGDADPIRLYTPGFAPRTDSTVQPTPADDLYALGALMAYLLFPYNLVYFLDPSTKERLIPKMVRDVGLPSEIAPLIVALMQNDPKARAGLEEALLIIERIPEDRLGSGVCGDSESSETIAGNLTDPQLLVSFVKAKLVSDARDRLVPADKEVFSTNPYSVSHGAAGVAAVLLQVDGAIPEELERRLGDLRVSNREVPPGLYMGMSGLAWAMWDCGLHKQALRYMTQACEHPLALTDPSYMDGAAGHLIAALYLYSVSGEKVFCAFALRAAEWMASRATETESGLSWEYESFQNGLGNGGSGIALAYLYLYAVTGKAEFLQIGRRALDHDLAASMSTPDGGVSWPRVGAKSSIVYPYWRQGSAGVSAVLARFLMMTGDPGYQDWADRIFVDLDREYALFPGLFSGLAGLGHSLLDSHRLLGDGRYLRAARKIEKGLQAHLIPRKEGLAVPGDGLFRFSCDYATGSCGVMSFFHRLVAGGSTPFFPDELLFNA